MESQRSFFMRLGRGVLLAVLALFFLTGFVLPDMLQEKRSAATEIEQTIAESGIDAATARFAEMRTAEKENFRFDQKAFNNLGLKLKYSGKIKEAVGVFKMNVELFPESKDAWFSLAQGFVQNVDKEKAIQSYKKVLELDPNFGRAKAELGWIDSRIDDARLETREPFRFSSGENMGLSGLYLGQEPPGLKPKKFAPGIVSAYGAIELCCTFSADGKEIYFQRVGKGIMVCKLTEKGWVAPVKTNISGSEVYIWPKNGNMYLNVRVPQPDGSILRGIGVIERSGNEWGEPTFLIPGGMFVTLSDNGTLYTTDVSRGKLSQYKLIKGKYTEGEPIDPETDSKYFDAHPCVAPDESFIIFDSQRPGNYALVDLFITFRKKDGSWAKAINLGEEINMPGINQCPLLSPDGKYLFYNCHNDIYWVSSEVIKKLRPLRKQKEMR